MSGNRPRCTRKMKDRRVPRQTRVTNLTAPSRILLDQMAFQCLRMNGLGQYLEAYSISRTTCKAKLSETTESRAVMGGTGQAYGLSDR